MIHEEDYEKHAKFQSFMRREYPQFVQKPYGAYNENTTNPLVWYNYATGEYIQFFPGSNYANLYSDYYGTQKKEIYQG